MEEAMIWPSVMSYGLNRA